MPLLKALIRTMNNRYSYTGNYQETIARANRYLHTLQDESQLSREEQALLLEVFTPRQNATDNLLDIFSEKIGNSGLFHLPAKFYQAYKANRLATQYDIYDHGLAMLATQAYEKLKKKCEDYADGRTLYTDTYQRINYLFFFGDNRELTPDEITVLIDIANDNTATPYPAILTLVAKQIQAAGLLGLPTKLFYYCKATKVDDAYGYQLAKYATKFYREFGKNEPEFSKKMTYVSEEKKLLAEWLPLLFFDRTIETGHDRIVDAPFLIDAKIRKRELQALAPLFHSGSATSPIQILASKIFIEQGVDREKLFTTLQLLFEIEDLRPMLHIVAVEAKRNPKFNILIFNRSCPSGNGLAGYYNEANTTRIGYGTVDNGTLMHEITHHALNILYQNSSIPWSQAQEQTRQPQFEKVAMQVLENLEKRCPQEEKTAEPENIDSLVTTRKIQLTQPSYRKGLELSESLTKRKSRDVILEKIKFTVLDSFSINYAENQTQYCELIVRYPEQLARGIAYNYLAEFLGPLITFYKQIQLNISSAAAISSHQASYVITILLPLLLSKKIQLADVIEACSNLHTLVDFIISLNESSTLLKMIIDHNDILILPLLFDNSHREKMFTQENSDVALQKIAQLDRREIAKSMRHHNVVFSEAKKSTVLFSLLSDRPSLGHHESPENDITRLLIEFRNLVFLGANIQATKNGKTLLSVSLEQHRREWFDYFVTETNISLSPEDKKHILGYANALFHQNECETQALFARLITMGADLHQHKFALLKTCVIRGYQSLFTYLLTLAPIQPNETEAVIDLLCYRRFDNKTMSRLPFAKIAMTNGLNIYASTQEKPFLLCLLNKEIGADVFLYFCGLIKEPPTPTYQSSITLQHTGAEFMHDVQQLIASATQTENDDLLDEHWDAFHYEINTLTAQGETLFSLVCTKIAEHLTQGSLRSTKLIELLGEIHRLGGTFPSQVFAADEPLQLCTMGM